ncbi:MAG: glutamate 5-kinase [Kosmotogales bacterium]|nr:glutamate 5-kinase [Kosmotogales bacterium]
MSKVVIKIGSNLLVDRDGEINKKYIAELCREVSQVFMAGNNVVLVTSGSKAAGYGYLKEKINKSDLYIKQALCSAGQIQIVKIYENVFDLYNIKVAQILLTRDDFSDRKRFLNFRNTMIGLTQMKIIPIINENDTIATEEIKFGDNDILASMFAIGWAADYLILLTSCDGVIAEDGSLIKEYHEGINLKVFNSTSWGSGGITSKINAAHNASKNGVRACICNGKKFENINGFLSTGYAGTVFLPEEQPKARKSWIGFLTKSKGKIYLNKGAERALKTGKSVLAIGIMNVTGSFNEGDIVDIFIENKPIGRGIINFSSKELELIKGLKSNQIENRLGHSCSKVVMHTDNIQIK